MRRNGDSDERVESVVNPSFMELQPDLSSDRGLGLEKNAEVECIARESLQRSKVDIVSLNGRAHQEL